MEANRASGERRIRLQDVTYSLTIAGDNTDLEAGQATTGDLDVTGTITIVGNRAVIQGQGTNGLHRLFHVRSGGTLRIDSVLLRDGNAAWGGGVIFNEGALSITNALVSGGVAISGGGIENAGSMALTDVTIRGNATSQSNGGGIHNSGTATLTRVLVAENAVSRAERGGGIYNSGTMAVVDGTVRDNRGFHGAGIYNTGDLQLTGCTITGNAATWELGIGGLENAGGTVTMEDTTISGNTPFDTNP
jgi:hypothetical protein